MNEKNIERNKQKNEKTQSKKDILEPYKWAAGVLSIFILIAGLFLVYMGFRNILGSLYFSSGILKSLTLAIKYSYGFSLFFELVALIVGVVYTWKFYRGAPTEMGAFGAFLALAILLMFTYTIAFVMLIYYQVSSLEHLKNFVRDFILWGGLTVGLIILLILEFIILGAAHSKRHSILKS